MIFSRRKRQVTVIIITFLLYIQTIHVNRFNDLQDHEEVQKMIPLRLFPCRKNSENCFANESELDFKVVIAGTIRDNQHRIGNMRTSVEKVASLFRDYEILIVENDSQDETRQELLKWSDENSKVKVLGCEVNSPVCNLNLAKTQGHGHDSDRIHKMATIRNKYLEYIQKNNIDYDYLIVWDFDIEGTVYLESLWNSFGHFQKDATIDGICSNGVSPDKSYGWKYYDPFAHKENEEDPPIIPHDPYTQFKLWWTMKRGDPLHSVKSCFGGMTIYRIPSIIATNATYDYSRTQDVICEHVFFHKPLNMYLNPSMIRIVYKNE